MYVAVSLRALLAAFLALPSFHRAHKVGIGKQLFLVFQTGDHAFSLDYQWVRAGLGLRDESERLEDRGRHSGLLLVG
jgi:hypothetical protein